MNIFQLLPLLEGWIDEPVTVEETIVKKAKKVYDDEERGWLAGIDLVTDDALGSMQIQYGRYISGWANPYKAYTYNAVYPPPCGAYFLLYSQPAPPSTAGLYVMSVLTSAYPHPYKGKIKVWVKLDDLSTQDSASIVVAIPRIKIYDPDLFKRSLKEVLEQLGLTKVN